MLRELVNQDFLTLILVVCLVFVAVAKVLFPKRFDEFAALLINSRYSSLYVRDQRFFDTFEALLFLNLVLNTSVLIYVFMSFSTIKTLTYLSLFKYAIIIGVFMILKILFERLLSSILDIEAIVDKYLFQKISFRNFIGLILIPVNAILLYSLTPNSTLFIVVVSLIILVFFFGIFLFTKNNLNTLKKSLFYFILYLCALEIAPYVVFYKIMTTN